MLDTGAICSTFTSTSRMASESPVGEPSNRGRYVIHHDWLWIHLAEPNSAEPLVQSVLANIGQTHDGDSGPELLAHERKVLRIQQCSSHDEYVGLGSRKNPAHIVER
jgi:hypothetical protein